MELTPPEKQDLFIDELIGRRALVKIDRRYSRGSDVTEIKILEVTPSGRWVKLMDLVGRRFWLPVTGVTVVEVLADLNAPTEPKPA